MKKSILLAGVLFSLTACANSGEPTQTTTQTQAPQATQIPKKAEELWIDVRSAQEFAQGHLSDSINISHDIIKEQIAQVAPDKSTPIHLYCQSGRRAGIALDTLKQLGYTNVTNHGGYQDLVGQGLK